MIAWIFAVVSGLYSREKLLEEYEKWLVLHHRGAAENVESVEFEDCICLFSEAPLSHFPSSVHQFGPTFAEYLGLNEAQYCLRKVIVEDDIIPCFIIKGEFKFVH